ncbi:MAG: N-formylglutamate deformylase [Alphaproteobacteria bacterium]|nr:MAG: N-formylglutamate deformylase [Alphaproteobacteria bacterium]
MTAFHFTPGDSPLLVSMPHVGIHIAPEIKSNLTDVAGKVIDTDWYLHELYNFLADRGVSILQAHYSRTVIDLNRDPAGTSLYPGQSVTEMCPTTGFDNQPLYQDGCLPDDEEVQRRKAAYWQPYHDKIRAELDRIKDKFGYALLWDAHSIQSQVPRFFDGRLPDLNLGSGAGTSCAPELGQDLLSIASASPYSAVLNGRFKGGYITRHYGDPEQGIHAIQLEISQIIYMDEAPTFEFQESRAAKLRPVLQDMIARCADFTPATS